MRDGGPPVLFSGTLTPRNLDRIVRLGDGWIPIMGERLEGIAQGIERLRAAYTDAGRNADQLIVRAPLPVRRDSDKKPVLEATLDGAETLAEVGVTDVYLAFTAFADDTAAAERFLVDLESALR